MTRLRGLGLLALLCPALAAHGQTPAPSTLERAEALRARLGAECSRALADAEVMFRARSFSRLAPRVREQFAVALAECAIAQGDAKLARVAARRAGERSAGIAALAEMAVATSEERYVDARAALAVLARSDPGRIPPLAERVVWDLYFGISALDDPAELLAFHEAARAAGFQPRQASDQALLRLEHARLLLDQRQLERARERLAGPLTAAMVVQIRSDKRFDALREDPAFESRLDARRAAEADIARARLAVKSAPRRLEARLELLSALRTAGRVGDVVVEAQRAQALDAESAGAHFEDRGEHWNQLLDHLGSALYAAGQNDAAARAFRQAIAHGEQGAANVSQVIDFALELVDRGEPDRALLTLKLVGEPSGYGAMWVAATRACANAQLGNARKLGEALARLVARERDNRAARRRGLLCAGELELAADLLIRRLADPSQRGDALSSLQIYQAPKRSIPPQRALLIERLRSVREREDVQRAVDGVGRIESIPLPSDGLGGI